MLKSETLKQIAEIMKTDAACCKDKTDVAFPQYESQIREEMMGKGVPVDEYIAWTPEHLVRDVDLEYVLEKL